MSYVLAETKVIPAVGSLMSYILDFWSELPDLAVAGPVLTLPSWVSAPLQLIISAFGTDWQTKVFLEWLSSSDPYFMATLNLGPYFKIPEFHARRWPPPAVFFYHGTYLRTGPFNAAKGPLSDFQPQDKSLLASARLSQAKTRRRVMKLKHHRAGYVLEKTSPNP